ncbi:MAG: outer membrane lipoprotein-sorting protein [Opitutae bacterium]
MKLLQWLLFTFISILIFVKTSFAQPSFPARGFSAILDDSQAEEKLAAFREVFFAEPQQTVYHQAYLYRFQFVHYPKSGRPIIHHGLLSGPFPNSSTLRVDLLSSPLEIESFASFLLIRDQNSSRAWHYEKGGAEIKELSPTNWLLPWTLGVNHTPFDLLMPFVTWPVEYEKSGRVCGRPAHLFVFSPSQDFSRFPSSIRAVRLAIDDTYNAPLRIEYMDGGILPFRIFSLQSFKKVKDQWVVKTIDAKDRDSQSRTRYELQAVAHGLDLAPSVFQPNELRQPIVQSSISFTAL